MLLAEPPKTALLSNMIASEVLLGLAVGDGCGTDRHWRWRDSGGLPLFQDLCSPRMGLQMVHEQVHFWKRWKTICKTAQHTVLETGHEVNSRLEGEYS